jgi:hypothetical protein
MMKMSNEVIHVGSAPDGSIVMFPFSAYFFMKICNPYTGIGGVVELFHGTHLTYDDLDKRGLGVYCKVMYDDIADFFETIDEEE